MRHEPTSDSVSDSASDSLRERLLSGQIDIDDDVVQDRLVTDDALRDWLDDHLEVLRALDRSGALAREILGEEEAARFPAETLAGADRVAPTLRSLVGPTERAPVLLAPRLLVAAVVLIAAVGFALGPWQQDAATPPSDPTFLGAATASIVDGPRGQVESFGPFRPGPVYLEDRDWRFIVQVYAISGASETLIDEGSFGFGEEWSIAPAKLGDTSQIHWQAQVVDDAGENVTLDEDWATRSP